MFNSRVIHSLRFILPKCLRERERLPIDYLLMVATLVGGGLPRRGRPLQRESNQNTLFHLLQWLFFYIYISEFTSNIIYRVV